MNRKSCIAQTLCASTALVSLLVVGSPAGASTGTPNAWGSVGQDGNGSANPLLSPTAITGIPGTVVQIATSNSDDYFLTSTGQVWAWGLGTKGELGNGKTSNDFGVPVQVTFPGTVTISSLANPMPYDTALAIDSDGKVWGWGYDSFDQLCMTRSKVKTPLEISGLSDVTLVSGAGDHALYDSGGSLYGCGGNGNGDLGNGTSTRSSTPAPVTGLPNEAISALTASWRGSGAVMADGSYYDWGFNKFGCMGDDSTADVTEPTRVDLESGVSEIYQGGDNGTDGQTIALLDDGTLWAWGNNKFDQLDIGSPGDAMVPEQVYVPSGETWSYVATGGATSYAIDENGDVWAWGANSTGQVGNGTSGRAVKAPTDVAHSAVALSATAHNVLDLDPTQ